MTRSDSHLSIRLATEHDHPAIWAILEPMLHGGDAYALPTTLTRAEALAYWFAAGHEVFVAVEGDAVVGTYFLTANQRGGGAHVSNCGYVTSTNATGKGIARAMCAHSLEHAKARGFAAMQFNFVVSTNERAVKLWHAMGFNTVGRVPAAFNHPQLGLVDALVMHRFL